MILYIQTAFLGDLLLSIPTLKRLREIYPKKKIHLICRKNLGSLFIENNLIDVVHDQFANTKPNFSEVRKIFSKYEYELLICPHESFRSTWISYLIRAQRKVGYQNWLNRLVFSDCIKRPMQYPEALRQLSLLSAINPETSTRLASLKEKSSPFQSIPEWSTMSLPQYQNDDKKTKWKNKYNLADGKKTVCLAPGSVWPTKQWGVDKYSELAGELLKTNHQMLLVGHASEIDLCQKIEKENPGLINFAGKTNLLELAEIIAVSDRLVSNDSGTMHVAAMTSTPSVSIFGPTVLKFGYQPWNEKSVVVENQKLLCRPCSSHGGKVCPIGTHECMTSIPVRDVRDRL
jgi:heptosyltransferase II